MHRSFFKEHAADVRVIAGLFLLLCLHLSIFWPGIMTLDSQSQYAMAVQGVYSDANPFMMSWLWRQFYLFVYPGSGMMLALHLCLLYVGTYFFSKAWKPYGWAALVIPFIPGVMTYSGMIWKDVGMAFCYFSIAGYLSMITVQKRPLSLGAMATILPVLVYGTTVKFQGMYLAPVVLVWMGLLRCEYRFGLRLLFQTMCISGAFYGLMALILAISPPVKQDHYWQYVKIFDLAALSVKNQTDLFPLHTKTEHFSLPALYDQFSSRCVDDLVAATSNSFPLVKKTLDPEEMQLLWHTWAKEVIKHPVDYLIHRFTILVRYSLAQTAEWEYIRDSLSLSQGTWSYLFVKGICFPFFAPLFTICVGILYWGVGLVWWRRCVYAKALFMLTTIALTMVGVLLFFSMAGTPRYVYISLCLIHGGHGLAYLCWQQIRKKVPQTT